MTLCCLVSRNLPKKPPSWRPPNHPKGPAWAVHTYFARRRPPKVDTTHRGHGNVQAVNFAHHTYVHRASTSDSVWLIMWLFPENERGVS